MPEPTPDKPTLRRIARERLAALSDADRSAASRAISDALLATLAAHARVLVYLPLPTEVDLADAARALMARGVEVAAPRLDWDARTMDAVPIDTWPPAVERRHHGVPEPLPAPVIPPDRLDAVIVPALAFDNAGGRLGRGGGFYDRFLAQLPTSTRRLGVCFAAQVVERVPVDKHDVRMHQVVCELGPIMRDSPT